MQLHNSLKNNCVFSLHQLTYTGCLIIL